jgi:thiaminase (transcriptional activator TenA)
MVREIAAGSLPHGIFRRYFEQNVLYLGDYARAIGLITGKAPDLEAADVLSRFLRQIVGTEIPANLAFLQRLGGSPAGPLMAAPPPDPVYADWIAMFGGAGYAGLVEETTGLLDRLADPRDAIVMQRLSWIFDTSTGYEVQFWDMAYGAAAGGGAPPGEEPAP